MRLFAPGAEKSLNRAPGRRRPPLVGPRRARARLHPVRDQPADRIARVAHEAGGSEDRDVERAVIASTREKLSVYGLRRLAGVKEQLTELTFTDGRVSEAGVVAPGRTDWVWCQVERAHEGVTHPAHWHGRTISVGTLSVLLPSAIAWLCLPYSHSALTGRGSAKTGTYFFTAPWI